MVRAFANAPLTAAALAIATSVFGASCSMRADLIFICTGAKGFKRGHALTIGNVILTGEKDIANLRPGLIAHEIGHADTWAHVGLSGGITAQLIAGLLDLANRNVDDLIGANGCLILSDWISYALSGDHGGYCD